MNLFRFIANVIWFLGMAAIALVYFIACTAGKMRKPNDRFYE